MGKARWGVLVAAVCLVVAAVAIAYAAGKAKAVPVQQVVRAERFELVGSKGKVRADLGLLPDGTLALDLHDRDGKLRAHLGLLPDGSPGLALCDTDGKGRAGLVVLSDDTPHLVLFDKDGRLRVEAAVRPDGAPGLDLYDQAGKLRAVLGATVIGTNRTSTVARRPESSLVLFDKEGKVLWQAPQ